MVEHQKQLLRPSSYMYLQSLVDAPVLDVPEYHCAVRTPCEQIATVAHQTSTGKLLPLLRRQVRM